MSGTRPVQPIWGSPLSRPARVCHRHADIGSDLRLSLARTPCDTGVKLGAALGAKVLGCHEIETRGRSQRSRAEWHAALLEAALARPGTRELMEVVEDWRERDGRLDGFRAARIAVGRGRTFTTDRSLPPLD